LAFLPLTIPTVFNPIFTGRLVARIGSRVPAVSGFLLMSGGTLVQAFAPALSVVALALLGFGVSLTIPSLLTAILGSLLNVTTTAVALVVVSALLLAGASIVAGPRA
jgi:DHA2 family methylenomycin A resistance protein-like MFS transporter